jgi:hypothetical protein
MHKVILLALSVVLSARCASQTGWVSITHDNGFHIHLPSYFKPGLLVAAGTLQYYDNTLDSSISLAVETFGIGTKDQLRREYTERRKNGMATYFVLKDTWFVVSGQSDEGIYYQKTIISNGVMHSLFIRYPADRQGEVNQFIENTVASFH